MNTIPRREQCDRVAKYFEQRALRDVSLAQLIAQQPPHLDPVIFKRAKHVISENERTKRALSALHANDMATLSDLMAQSHFSMKDDFEITTPELDFLVEIISPILGSRGGGVRMTGGGFGGCIIALTPDELVCHVKSIINEKYLLETGAKCRCLRM